jgi:uncharacterized protein
MFIDVQQLPPEGQSIDLEIPEREFAAQDEIRLMDRVHVSGRLSPVDDGGICLLGDMKASIEMGCVRCLEPLSIDIDEKLDLLFMPQSANVGPGEGEDEERELTDEDMSVSFYKDDKIDVNQIVREQIYLALPMKPLCKEDCRGLCSQCGTNLNLSKCSCEKDLVDPRLAKLKTLLDS